MKQISLEALPQFLKKISETSAVIAPVENAGQVDFAAWDETKKLRLDVLKTVKSAKGAFFPQVEDMVKFHMQGKNIDIQPCDVLDEDFVIFGVRACDARSFELLDRVFLADPVDPYYAARRKHGTVVTLACGEPEESCFCSNFGIDAAEPAGDVTCWLDKDRLLLRANTEKGEKFVESLEEADENSADEIKNSIREITKRLPLSDLNLEGFDGEHLMEKFNDPRWSKLSEGCLGCGTCTFVCPTCQCYDVRDFDTGNGIQRYRCWDSCMYSDFTLMAHGTNRPTQTERFRQRFMHKLVYFPSKNEGLYSCVGCGRCLTKCPQSMHIVKIIKTLGVKEDA
jgi:heterodisulfide reductase subunit C